MTDPATQPCSCRNGTVIDSNGAAWRCALCNGSGRVCVESVEDAPEGTEDDDLFLSEERLALVRLWCAPRKDAA